MEVVSQGSADSQIPPIDGGSEGNLETPMTVQRVGMAVTSQHSANGGSDDLQSCYYDELNSKQLFREGALQRGRAYQMVPQRKGTGS